MMSWSFGSLLVAAVLLILLSSDFIPMMMVEAKKSKASSAFSGGIFGNKGRAVADIPNPMQDPLSCGRTAVAKSAICDPDQILSKDKQDIAEGYINAITNAEVAVVLIQKMHMKGISARNIDDAAEEFAKYLHNKWGVGDKETNNGIVLFLSIDDRIVYISTGFGVKKEINSDIIQSIISGMRPLLRKGDYGSAIAQAIVEMDLALNGKFESKIRKAYGYRPDGIDRPIEEESNGESYLALGFFGIFVGVAFFLQYRRNRQLVGYERGTAAMNRIMKEVERAEDNKFCATSCPICLEEFPKPEVIRLEQQEMDHTEAVTSPGNTAATTVTPFANTEEEKDSGTASVASVGDVGSNTSEMEDETLRRRRDPNGNASPHSNSLSTGMSSTTTTFTNTGSTGTSEDDKKKVMALRCGHAFCRGCLEEYLKSVNAYKCPICRNPVDGDDHSHPPQQPQETPSRTTSSTTNASQSTIRRRGGFFSSFSSNRSAAQYDYTSTTSTSTASTTTRMQENSNGGGTATYTQTTTEPSGTTSDSNGGDNSGSSGSMFYGRNSMFRRRSPEFRFRLHRMHHMYPDIMTLELLRAMSYHVDQGQVQDFRNQAVARNAEINRIVTDIRKAAEQSARNNGMRGSSRSSFGGGSSGGGGGGRW